MVQVLTLFCLVLALAGVHSEKDSEDFHKLPKLFHLDDFERCLDKQDGIYCLGEFEVYSDVQPNPIYDIIQEKSQDVMLYNRSYLHRGYCLPTRCPSREGNATARFERCVDASARRYSLRARLRTLHYCRAHGQPRPREPDTTDLPHRVVLYFAYTMLVMAVIGTSYDYFAKKDSRNPLLMSFSLRMNWNHLTSVYSDMDPRMKDLQIFGLFRFLLGIGFSLCHVINFTASIYQYNPRFMEKFYDGPPGVTLGAATMTMLIYTMISTFLTTYNILLMSESLNLSLKLFPLLVLKRIVRFYPIYILVIGFAATWWKSFGDGPMWPVLVASESEICRKKFWVTAVFLQNFIYKKEFCFPATWIIAVDIQLHLLTLFMILLLLKHREHAGKIIFLFFVAATALLAYLAFELDLVPAYYYQNPESIRNSFLNEDSVFNLYINPISGLINAIAGLMLAFIHMDHQKRGIKMSRSKIMVFLHYLSVPAFFLRWYLCYVYFKHYDRPTQNMMVVVERLFDATLMSFILYGLLNCKSILHYMASWRPLQLITKMSMAYSMCHWCIIVLLCTNRWTLHSSSYLQIVVDTIAVYVLTHLVALPLTLLVEYPLQKVLNRLLNYTGQHWLSLKKKKE